MRNKDEPICSRRYRVDVTLPALVATILVVFVAVHFVDLAVFGSRSSREAQLQSDARAEEQAFDALDMTEIKQNLQDCASLHDTNSALVKNIASLEEKFARLEKACQG